MAEDVTVTGLKELDRDLRKLGDATEKKAIRSGLMYGSTPMWKDARSRANVGQTGNLRDQVRRRSRKTFKGFVVQIYVRTGKKLGELDAYYWRFQHFLSAKTRGAKGGSGGSPNPFLTNAFDSGVENAAQRSVTGIRRGIAKELKKLSKK